MFTKKELHVQPMKYFIVSQPCIVNKAISFLTLTLTKKDKKEGAEYLTRVLRTEIFILANCNKVPEIRSQTRKNISNAVVFREV